MTESGTDNRPQCFVAMWFGADKNSKDEMNQLFEMVIKPAIEHHGMKPYRVDLDHSADKIDETIFVEIDRSNLMVADFTHDPKTGLRGNVVFEAGYAYRTMPMVWMCREDLSDHIPFDMRQFRQIRWTLRTLSNAKQELVDLIGARIRERGKKSETHEVRRLIADMWKRLKEAKDLTVTFPDSKQKSKLTADQIRFEYFKEFCDDLDTRAKYKKMSLSADERYELIELVRNFRKVVINPTPNNAVPTMGIYRELVESKLRASGWLK